MSLTQTIRDNIIYQHGYFQGRSNVLTEFAWNTYTTVLSRTSSMISLPLPFLSFLALPFFGSTSTTVNLAFFWLTWSAVVWSHDPLQIEIYGTLAIKLLFFLLPSFAFLAFDALVSSLSASMKAAGDKQLPNNGPSGRKLMNIAGVATMNTLLEVAVQAVTECVLTEYLHFRSGLRVSTFVPPPWSIAKDILRALIIRGFLHYTVHRYILHSSTHRRPLARWHNAWAHSITYPFSLVAAYDHPVCHLLARWLPVYLPALFFRYHVLTWHILVAFTSLEQLFIYSGYAVLPSRILLAGMARRTDSHYATKGDGNFGNWGVLDWAFGTTCAGEADVVDDLQDEAEKSDVKGRVSKAQRNANGLVGDAKDRFGKADKHTEDAAVDEDAAVEDEAEYGGRRRSKRKGTKLSGNS